jgi:hypothetical protein
MDVAGMPISASARGASKAIGFFRMICSYHSRAFLQSNQMREIKVNRNTEAQSKQQGYKQGTGMEALVAA